MKRYIRSMARLIAFGALLTSFSGISQAQTNPSELCFIETGQCISGRFRTFWEQNGGLPLFGFPIQAQKEEQVEGKAFQVQWFERNRFELHPENLAPNDVLLGRLSDDILLQSKRDWRTFPKSSAKEGCRFAANTGHNICGAILARWRALGIESDGQPGFSEAENIALFGEPISDEQVEVLSDGKTYTVQWFERVRFELHPEKTPPFDILLGRLGTELRPLDPKATATQVKAATPSVAPTMPKATPLPSPSAGAAATVVQPVTNIPLAEFGDNQKLDIAGMAWYSDTLIIVPQYPNSPSNNLGYNSAFRLSKAALLAFLDGQTNEPLQFQPIPFFDPGLAGMVKGFKGYGSTAIVGDRIFVTLNAQTTKGKKSYLVQGKITPYFNILLDVTSLTEIPAQSKTSDFEQALFVLGNKVVTINAVNGQNFNLKPVIQLFDANSRHPLRLSASPMPNVEYRVLAASEPDTANRFWVINAFGPEDQKLLPKSDPLAAKYGQSVNLAQANQLSRLVEFQYSAAGLVLIDQAPLDLPLTVKGQNWRSLIRVANRGLLIATDKDPQTLLGFIPTP